MATDRPGDIPNWADNPIPTVTQIIKPISGIRDAGWAPTQRVPSASFNWAWNDFARWAAHQASGTSVFKTLQEAITPTVDAVSGSFAPFVVGGSCFINEDDGGLPGETILATLDASITLAVGVDSTAQYVVVQAAVAASADAFHLFPRVGGLKVQSFSLTNAAIGTPPFLADGEAIVVAYDDGATATVELFEPDGAGQYVSSWVVNPIAATQSITDLAWDDTQIYIVGNNPGGELIALDRATGATNWTYDHSGPGTAQLWSVTTNGRLVFVAGVASLHPSGATIRGIVAANGFDAAGEGGLGTDATLAWDAVQGSTTILGGLMDTDGRRIFVGQGVDELEVRGCGDGVVRGSRTARTSVVSVRSDQDYVLVTDGTETVAWTKPTLSEAWRGVGAVGGAGRNKCVTDGTAIFTADAKRLARGNERPTMFRRVDPSAETWLSMRQLLVPVSRG